jgi:hypothetical protein
MVSEVSSELCVEKKRNNQGTGTPPLIVISGFKGRPLMNWQGAET